MNEYESKLEAKRERYLALADKAEAESAAQYKRADLSESATGIPFGQPILVGHHSEARHRRTLERADNAMRKSIEADEKAKYYRGKAAGVGHGGISSDDPEAATKLYQKIARCKANQHNMKAANKIVRKKIEDEQKIAELVAMGIGETNARALLEPDFCGRVGFPGYALQNNNANIRRMEKRLQQLRAKPTETETQKIGEVELVENADDNRTQLFFPGKPSADIRKTLKSHGFRWAPSVGAWQRHMSTQATYWAEIIAQAHKEENHG